MNSPAAANFKVEVERALQRRKDLMRLCNDTPGVEPDDLLRAEIVSINQTVLPTLRQRILAASHIPKGKEKHQLLELVGLIDGEMSGIGTDYVLDVSDERLDLLKRQQTAAKSHREAKHIAKQINSIEWALSESKKQKELRARDQPCREEIASEIRRLDELLYGHLKDKQ
jgi:hypothetical protein